MIVLKNQTGRNCLLALMLPAVPGKIIHCCIRERYSKRGVQMLHLYIVFLISSPVLSSIFQMVYLLSRYAKPFCFMGKAVKIPMSAV